MAGRVPWVPLLLKNAGPKPAAARTWYVQRSEGVYADPSAARASPREAGTYEHVTAPGSGFPARRIVEASHPPIRDEGHRIWAQEQQLTLEPITNPLSACGPPVAQGTLPSTAIGAFDDRGPRSASMDANLARTIHIDGVSKRAASVDGSKRYSDTTSAVAVGT
jgi:hypothetical protein